MCFCNPYLNHIDSRLSSEFLVNAANPASSPEIDIVVVVTDDPTSRKRSIHAFSTPGTVKDQKIPQARKGQRERPESS